MPPRKRTRPRGLSLDVVFNPLSFSYRSYGKLDEDAENQLNISGSNFHVYIYAINDDLSVTQVKHESFQVED